MDRVKKALFFSILMDECKDSAGKEQMALFFRYVYWDPLARKFSVAEDITALIFLHCPVTSGKALFEILLEYCTKREFLCTTARARGMLEGVTSGPRDSSIPKDPLSLV